MKITSKCSHCNSDHETELQVDDDQLHNLSVWIEEQLTKGVHLQMDSQIAIDVLDENGEKIERKFIHPSKVPMPQVVAIHPVKEETK